MARPSSAVAVLSTTLDVSVRLAETQARLARRFELELGAVHGIGFTDLLLMLHLGQAIDQRLSRTELSARLGLSASGVTRVLVPLERQGLVAREPDFRNLRAGRVSLTPAGEERLQEALATAEHIATELLGRWEPADVQALSRLLSRLGLP